MTAAAKKDTSKSEVKPEVKPEVQPQPATPAPAVAAVAATPSKQQMTLDNLKQAWTKRGVDLSKMQTKVDGKYLFVIVGDGWPEVRIGTAGGIDLPQIKSYPKAWDAAVEADKLWAKQVARAQKAAAPAPTTTKPAAQPSEKKEESKQTPASKKAAEHAQLEKQIESRA